MRTSATGKERQGGFTLIELMVVLAIIGLMSAAVVLALYIVDQGDVLGVDLVKQQAAVVEEQRGALRLKRGDPLLQIELATRFQGDEVVDQLAGVDAAD